MQKLLFAVGTSFLRAFAVSFLFFAPGILAATNVDSAVALSIAALAASVAAGLRTIQVFIPALSWASVISQPYAAWLDAFTRMFLATFTTSVMGWLATPDLSGGKAILLGAFTGAATAGLRALQGLASPSELPAPDSGLEVPDPPIVVDNP